MRLIFGVLSLLIVVAIIGSVAKKQLDATGVIGRTTTRAAAQGSDAQAVTDAVMGRAREGGAAAVAVPGGMPAAAPAAVEGTVPMQAQAIQNNVRDATNAALQQGAAQRAAAQQP
ncbi:MAG TPA: hypothetical protein VFQ16_12760 [Burkholderiaceae bacterium]|nr:hypothetical protein [Burkholderiaceae bacterium]